MAYLRCPKGHYYKDEFEECPFCKAAAEMEAEAAAPAAPVSGETMLAPDAGETILVPDAGETRLAPDPVAPAPHAPVHPADVSGATMLIDHSVRKDPDSGEFRVMEDTRGYRKLVGWLVSYTIDEMGVDFKLFEGRNMIGRDPSCAVCVKDPAASLNHAMLLYRSGRYSIMDQQSTSGTFVNDEDIELDPRYLKDGDLIRIGQTVFKFKSSL